MSANQSSEVPADLKSRMESTYDAIAKTYNEVLASENDPIRKRFTSQLIQLLQQNTTEKASVLELGCGAGVPGTKTLLETKQPVINVIGNDLSSKQIDLARERLADFEETGRLEFRQGDMMALDFPPASFEAVVAFYSIIHLPRQEQTELLGRIAKWLKPGGFLLANFSKEEMSHNVNTNWLGEEKGWAYWSGWGEEGSAKMVEDAGLSIVVREITDSEVDASFLWIIAAKH